MEHPQPELHSQSGELRLFDVDEPANKFNRVLLKLSGEALMGNAGSGVDNAIADRFSEEIVHVRAKYNVEIAIVVGGGNFWRGSHHPEMERSAADFTGMLATVMNAIVMKDKLEKLGQNTRVMSAIHMDQVAEPYIRGRAVRHLEKGRIVICAGGTGNPYFTTDTAAALRASEINADALLMAKNGVDGVYNADPRHDPEAQKIDELSYLDIINQELGVMDSTAATHAMENKMPIVVFDGQRSGGLEQALTNPFAGTLIK